jgi:glucosamine-6-phosphate deaminase
MSHSCMIDRMRVNIYDTPEALGVAAAADFAGILQEAIAAEGRVSAMLATGNSQLPFIHALRQIAGIEWPKVTLFHMDEYIGIPASHPGSLRYFLREKVISALHPGTFHAIDGDAPDPEAEMARYDDLLRAHRPAVCVLGIGENGHLAFNEPPADFTTDKVLTTITLSETSRRQQVGEGHFATVADVPPLAITVTIPALLAPPRVLAVVPEARKAVAVRAALEGPITPDCPASFLRTSPHVTLYLDQDSASLLKHN